MAKHKVITITVAYDEAHEIPSDDWIKEEVSYAVGDGLLSFNDTNTLIESWEVDVRDSLSILHEPPKEVLVRLSNRALVEAADNARALESDELIYRLLVDVEEPESGPPMEKGWLVRIIDFDAQMVPTIESLDPHEDSGNGEGDTRMLQSVARVSRKDIEEV